MSFQRYKLYYLLLHVWPAQTSEVLPIISDIRAHCTFVQTADRTSQQRCALTPATLQQPHLRCCWGFICFGYIHLSGFVLLSRPVFLKGRWRKLSVLIPAATTHTPLHIPTQSVRTVWVRQTDRQVSRTLLPDEVNPSIIQLVHRSIISCHLPSLLPAHPPAPSHPSLFPHFPLPSLSMLLPLTPDSSREVQSGPTCTIHVTNPKQSSTAPGVSNKWCCQQLRVLCWRLDRTNSS